MARRVQSTDAARTHDAPEIYMPLSKRCLILLAFFACGSPPDADDAIDADALAAVAAQPARAVCATSAPRAVRCHALVRAGPPGSDAATGKPKGLTPADLRSAYGLPAGGGRGTIVAVVDACDDPDAEQDLAAYRKQFGLPACTAANGCFRKVN